MNPLLVVSILAVYFAVLIAIYFLYSQPAIAMVFSRLWNDWRILIRRYFYFRTWQRRKYWLWLFSDRTRLPRWLLGNPRGIDADLL
jgi:hypothetical protein